MGEKGWGKSSCHKFEESQSVYFVPIFQNRGYVLSQGTFSERGLPVETEHEGWIFLSTSPSIVKEVSAFSMGKKSLRVPVPMLWAGPSPKYFNKLLKVPISMLRRINIRIIIYLRDMLLMGATVEEILMSRNTVIFLLQLLKSFWIWRCPFWTLLKKYNFLAWK